MGSKTGHVVILSVFLLELFSFVWTSNAQGIPPSNIPGYGMGQLCGGQKAEFFITAAGNNPYVSFHMRGNSTMMGAFRVMFERLLFFNDTDGDGKLTGADTVTNQKILSTLTWTTGDLVEVSTGDFEVTLNSTDGNFGNEEFIFHFQYATSNDTSNLLKFDWVVENMLDNIQTYNGGDHVALQVRFFIDIRGQNNQQDMHFLNGTGASNNSILCSPTTNEDDAQAGIAWVKKATINGTNNDHACGGNGADNSSAGATVELVNFAFPKFQNLTFEPTLEVMTPSGIPGFPIEIILGQVILVGGIFVFLLNRKIRNAQRRFV